MRINGIKYYFYEVEHPIYTVLIAETANQAYEYYINNVSNEDWLAVLKGIREVSLDYAEDKLKSKRELVYHRQLLNEGLSFRELVEKTLKESNVLLFDYKSIINKKENTND